MDLSIIIVNFNTKGFLTGCISSCYETIKKISFEIIVVDNASHDGSAQMVEHDFKKVKLLKNKENTGFAKANNQAILKSKGHIVLLLNPDIIVYPEAVEKMVEFICENNKVGAVGAKLLNADGTVQISGYYCKFPSVFQVMFFYTALRHVSLKIAYLKHKFWQHVDTDMLCEVDQPPGACLMIKRKVIDKIGLLDEEFPLFFNDVDLCYRIKQAGWKIFYYPQAKMVHYGGKSFISNDFEEKIKWSLISYRGLEKFFLKNGHVLKAMIIKWIIFIDSILKFPMWGMFYLLRKKQREKAKRVFQYNAAIINQWCLKR